MSKLDILAKVIRVTIYVILISIVVGWYGVWWWCRPASALFIHFWIAFVALVFWAFNRNKEY